MTSIHQINHNLQKVQNSQCFSKSVVVKELFKYLVEKSINSETPKEFEIAYEVFGNSQNKGKEKNIRIYVHNLRKKLDEYYKNEGAVDQIVFSIPKGGYKVQIHRNRKIIRRSRIASLSPYLLGLSLVVLLLATMVFTSRDRSLITRSYIWEGIYNSQYPLLIILGDHYFINSMNVLGSMTATRLTKINSDEEFNEMLEANPGVKGSFEKTEQTYINKQAPFGLYKVMSFLGGGHNEVNMRYSGNLKWEHLIATNTIFIGSYKTQNILKQIFEKIGITYVVPESKLLYTVKDSTSVYDSSNNDFLDIEYATFIYFKTKDERIAMSLMCKTDIGNVATIKYLSEPENLKELKTLVTDFPTENFKAVFEVSGNDQTDFKILVKRIDPITLNMDEIWP
ncbi:MAG: hypothetical protein HQ522_14610 [Bacteroidetes bacterium]|nr:hypothetical protein [Bacteroidota bacterium]